MSTTKIARSKALSIPMNPCDSSQVACYGYDHDTSTLSMQFKQGSGLSAVYHYKVTPEKYAELEKAESKGKFFGQHIKCLDCMKLVHDDDLHQAQEAA